MLGTLTLACNTCNPSLKCSRIIGNKVQTCIGCVRGRRVSTVFNIFRRFSIVFNCFVFLWAVLVFFFFFFFFFFIFFFFFFRLILFYYYFHFWYVFQKPTTGSPGGIGGLPPYPQQCEGHASRIMWGMSQTISWNLGQRIINAWVFNP